MVLKMHHAAVDGMAGIEMITAIHEQTPDRRIAAAARWSSGCRSSRRRGRLLSRASVNNLRGPRTLLV